MENESHPFDFIIIGSGFGGSVAALRLAEKGYRVLVLEQGDRFGADDFPSTNWKFSKYLWFPSLGWRGFFRINKFRHLTVLSGTGLGGGSLVYAGTLAIPEDSFFNEGSWAHLADWKHELRPFYSLAGEMLGSSPNPKPCDADVILKKIASGLKVEDRWKTVNAGVFFGEPGKNVPDPYFGGQGPDRSGCRFCGGCIVGCQYNAKNSLDKNYLCLAEKKGAKILTGVKAEAVIPLDPDGRTGYRVEWRSMVKKKMETATAGGVVLAGGVLGTMELLLGTKEKHLPNLSEMTGKNIRTNNESLIGVVSHDRQYKFSEGLSIGSILDMDNRVHVEPVRYPEGSDFLRIVAFPLTKGKNLPFRLARVLGNLLCHPAENLRIMLKRDIAPNTVILLVMQQKDHTLEFRAGRTGIKTWLKGKEKPSVHIPETEMIANRFAGQVNGKNLVLASETLFGTPTTAHIFGGAVMGRNAAEGVIDSQNRVFGYKNLYVCDGSMISANPGVNPSLTITAIAEKFMASFPGRIET